jgi:hypothetical protein
VLGVEQHVAGHHVLQLRDRADVTLAEAVGVLVLLALEAEQGAEPLASVRARVDERRVAGHLALEHAKDVDPPGERVGDRLEDEGGDARLLELDRRALPRRRRDALDDEVEERARAEVLRRDAAGDGEHLAAGDGVLERVRDLVHAELLAVEVALHQLLVGLDDGVEQPLAILGDDVLELGRNRARAVGARRLGAHVRGHVQEVDDPGQLVLAADRQVDGDTAVGELRAERLERAEEVGPLAVEHVHEDDPREAEIVGALPEPRRPDLDAHHAADGEQRALDHAQRRDRVALEARVARRVDEVDQAPLPVEVREPGGERHLAPVLVLVRVGDGRPLLDAAEAVRRAGLEERRLDEGRLPGPAVSDDGDVSDLRRLDGSHAR